jgi:hypothetical protein
MTIRHRDECRCNATVFDVIVENRVAQHQRARSTEDAAPSAGACRGAEKRSALRLGLRLGVKHGSNLVDDRE